MKTGLIIIQGTQQILVVIKTSSMVSRDEIVIIMIIIIMITIIIITCSLVSRSFVEFVVSVLSFDTR